MLSNVSQVLPNSKKIIIKKYNKMFFSQLIIKVLILYPPQLSKIVSLYFLRSRMIIAVSEMQAIVKLNQLHVLSPVLHLKFIASLI